MKKHWILILSLLIGVVGGALISELFDFAAPEGTVKTFFMKGVDFGLKSTTLELGAISLTFGFTMRFTVVSLFFILAIVYYFRWWMK